MNAEVKKRNYLSFDQQLAIYNLLKDETVLVTLDAEKKLVAYVDGWSDERVAREMTQKLGMTVTVNNVMGIRANQFGDLRIQTPTEARLVKLEQDTKALTERIMDLISAHNAAMRKVEELEKVIAGKGDAIAVLQRQVNTNKTATDTALQSVQTDIGKLKLKLKLG